MILRYLLLSTMFLGMCCACSEKSNVVKSLPNITVVTAINGTGDNGYNDEILSGIMDVNESNEVVLSLITPSTIKEVEDLLDEWINAGQSEERALLVLAENEYEMLLHNIVLPDNKQILVFESEGENMPDQVSSFMIHRYGISYLAGCMASEAASAYVVAAMKSDSYIEDAVNGFIDGYAVSARETEVIYLADDESGYAMPGEGYKVIGKIDEKSFIYPLAGGSNSGMYKAIREKEFSMNLIAGMDVDCSNYSNRVPFSVIFKIREVVSTLINEWISGGNLQSHYSFDLSDEEIVYISCSESFFDNLTIWEDYYSTPDYWEQMYDRYKEAAIEKEKKYYENR